MTLTEGSAVAALFIRRDSVYKTLGIDCWDDERDARFYPGPAPVITHPPCAQWGRLRHFAHEDYSLKSLSVLAVHLVRLYGGILEHPAHSLLWDYMNLPKPGREYRGGHFSLSVPQFWWGHKAMKKSWLYISGTTPEQLPTIPFCLGYPTHVVDSSWHGLKGTKYLPKGERDATPPRLAGWLVEVARRCGK